MGAVLAMAVIALVGVAVANRVRRPAPPVSPVHFEVRSPPVHVVTVPDGIPALMGFAAVSDRGDVMRYDDGQSWKYAFEAARAEATSPGWTFLHDGQQRGRVEAV